MKSPMIHIGLHKTASTWLQRRLFSTEKFGFAAPWGEVCDRAITDFVVMDPLSFDAEKLRWEYSEMWRGKVQSLVPVISHEALSSRPQYGIYYSGEVANRLKEVFIDAKIFIVVREQKSIIRSLYHEHVNTGGLLTLEQYLGSGDEKPGWRPKCMLSFFQYDRLIEYYSSLFGRDNVLCLPFEMLKSEPASFLDRIMEFASLQKIEHIDFSHENVSLATLTVKLQRLVNHFVRPNPLDPKNSALYEFCHNNLHRLNKAVLVRLTSQASEKEKKFIEERLGDYFDQSNQRLSDICGIELSKYGYQCA